MKPIHALPIAAAIALGSATTSAAVVCDLTSPGAECTINGAIFYTPSSDPSTGSGVIDSFVRISANTDTVQGYNTSDRPLQFDENSSPIFTKDLLLADVPFVTVNGLTYYEFILDINQTGADPLISLNRVQIFFGANQATDGSSYTSPSLTSNLGTLEGLSAPIYSLDSALTDNTITLDYSNYGGSGAGIDMIMLVPQSLFAGAGPNVYLYSYFGNPDNNNDGFEEWAVREFVTTCPPGDPDCDVPPEFIPEPGTLALFGLAALGVPLARRSRRTDRRS